jgi:hypothetical protein
MGVDAAFRMRSNMTVDQGIELVGLVATVIFGVSGFFVWRTMKTRKQVQRQSVTNGGTAIQSGRDTRIEK